MAATPDLVPREAPPRNYYERYYARRGFRRVAGVDEAGRGPLAGPVVAAAVVLHPALPTEGIDDSKLLPEPVREELFSRITARCAWAVGVVEPADIDRLNILQASLEAMRIAVGGLPERPDCLLVDGRDGIGLPVFQRPIVGGDGRSVSIGAASIVAKVTRDRIMRRLHERWPQYNFARHKGYATPEHFAALRRFGPCPAHRRTFHGVLP